VILVDLLHKLVLRHSFWRGIYMPALVSESPDGFGANIFKEEEPKALILNWMKDSWSTDVHGCATAPSADVIVKSRG
jgi:hypothetical protein